MSLDGYLELQIDGSFGGRNIFRVMDIFYVEVVISKCINLSKFIILYAYHVIICDP